MRTRRAVPALAVLLATTALALVPPAHAVDTGAGPGDLFPGFTPLGDEAVGGNSDITAVGVQSTGKIIIAQRTSTLTVLRRLHADGTADPSFGTSGRAETGEGWINHLLVLPDDRIVVAEQSVRQFTAEGAPDAGFSGDGIAPIDEEPGYQPAYTKSLTREPDGDIVVVGETFYTAEGDWDAFAQRWRSDGSVDPGFRSDHLTYLGNDVSADNLVSGALPAQDGGYHVLGQSGPWAQRRPAQSWHLAAGSIADADSVVIDELPASAGWTWIPGLDPATAYIVGSGETGPYLAELVVGPGGLAVEPAWGGASNRVLPLPGWAEAGAVQPDGKILLATYSGLLRLHSDGRIDGDFSSPPSAMAPHEGVVDVQVTADGGILAAGRALPAGSSVFTPRLDKYVGRLADVSTTISHTPAAGPTQTATITYRNTGPDPVSRARVVVDTPIGASAHLHPSQGSCAGDGTTATCTLGAVAAGAATSVQVTVTSTAPLTGAVTATGSSELFDPDNADQRSSVSVTTTVPTAAPPTAQPTAQSSPSSSTLVLVKRPVIRGTAEVGAKLKATTGTWTPAPTAYKYRWLRGGKAIKKATARTYRLTAKDRGKKIAVRVTAVRIGHTSGTATARAVRVTS